MRVVTDLPSLQNCVPAIPRDDICNNYIHTTSKEKGNKLEMKRHTHWFQAKKETPDKIARYTLWFPKYSHWD